MNIFQNRDSFFGCLSSEATNGSLLSLFKLAKQIRLKLGRQGYLLDCYLSIFFDVVHNEIAYDAADSGIQSGGEFQELLFHVLEGTEPKRPHPLYSKMQDIYKQNSDKLVFQERYTNFCLLLLPLADEIMTHATSQFVEKQEKNLNGVVDIIRMQELFDQISQVAGEAMIEHLNQQLCQRFQIAPAALVFAQGFTDDLLDKLTARDHETSKQMFQLYMDSLPDVP